MTIAIRTATQSDLVFVVESWLDSYRTAHARGLASMADFHASNRPHCRRILARDGVVVLVAHHPKAEAFKADVMGWLAYERGYQVPISRKVRGRHVKSMVDCDWPLIHYCYTKEPYRRIFGVCNALLAKAGIDRAQPFYATCKTGMLRDLPPLPAMEFNPLIAAFEKENHEQTSTETSTRTKQRHRRKAKA